MVAKDTDTFRRQARVLKALANESRLKIVDRLSRGECSVGELTEMIGSDPSTVSKHLAVLRAHGIVLDRREGNVVYYTRSPNGLPTTSCRWRPAAVWPWLLSSSFSRLRCAFEAEPGRRWPPFPGVTQRLSWSFPDPSAFTGSRSERLARVVEVREAIRERIEKRMWLRSRRFLSAPPLRIVVDRAWACRRVSHFEPNSFGVRLLAGGNSRSSKE